MNAKPPTGVPLILVNTAFTKKGSALVDADLPLADPAKTWWRVPDLAAHFGLADQTIRVYRTQGKLPKEDDRIGPIPVWKPETVIGWKIPGKGQGYRSDLKDGE